MLEQAARDPIDDIMDRLMGLHPRLIDLSLDRLRDLLVKLDSPETRLPPIIHVAGTNGKGSTCAFVRAMAEAAGLRVHVYTSPHLIRFNERIRVAGTLVTDDVLLAALAEVERVNAGAPITVFEVTTAAAFLLFARSGADLCVLEVGLGGRGDATNVTPPPVATAITSISLDHRELLGPTLDVIALEKAGIMKPGVPVVIGSQPPEVLDVLLAHARATGAPVWLRGRDWDVGVWRPDGGRTGEDARGSAERDRGRGQRPDGEWVPTLLYRDTTADAPLPPPSLPGAFQHDNAGIAIAAIRASGLPIPPAAIAAGIAAAEWPARMQRLRGALAAILPPDWELWLDGGHNPGGGVALADHLRTWADRPIHLIVGMKQAKDSAEFLRPLIPLAATLWAVREPGQHAALPIEAIIAASGGVARPGPTVTEALRALPNRHLPTTGLPTTGLPTTGAPNTGPARVLICGSLYLAGEILKLD